MFKLHKVTSLSILLIVFTIPTILYAGGSRSNISYDYASVISVKPIKKIHKISKPYRDCWTESDTYYSYEDDYYDDSPQHNSYTGTILGGLIGGGIGNALGHNKSNKKVGAVAGALLGSAIGHDLTHNNRHRHNRHRQHYPQKHCETRYDTYEEEKIVGYKVRYRYNGHVYKTRTKHHPGDTLRVKVVVSPAEN